jgi:hypothetical protein
MMSSSTTGPQLTIPINGVPPRIEIGPDDHTPKPHLLDATDAELFRLGREIKRFDRERRLARDASAKTQNAITRWVRRVLGLSVIVFLFGCGHSLTDTVSALEAGLVALDVELEDKAPKWEAYVQAKLSECAAKELPTEEERRACLGPAASAPKVAEALEAVTQAQDAALTATRLLKEVAPVIEKAAGDE